MNAQRPVVVVLDDWEGRWASSPALERLRRAAEVRIEREHLGPHDVIARAIDAQVLVLNRERTPVDAALFAALPRLRAIVNTGVGLNHIDRSAADARDVKLVPTGGDYTNAVVEQTFALMLGAVKRLPELDATVRSGAFPEALVLGDLSGARLGIAGVGSIGRGVARIACAFGMRVSGWSPSLTDGTASDLGIARVEGLRALAATSDVFAVCLRLTPQTRGIIASDVIDALPNGALFVNTARAELVDGEALFARAARGEVAVALDVYEREPDIDPRYRALAGALSPHVGWKSEATWSTFIASGIDKTLALLSGEHA